MSINGISGPSSAGGPNQPPRKPPAGGEVAGAGGESGGDDGPNRADEAGATDPLGVEPGKETLALIAEFKQTDDSIIVDRILEDRSVMLAVLRS